MPGPGATMEGVAVQEGNQVATKDELRAALIDVEDEQLNEMRGRLLKSNEGMNDIVQELAAERKTLNEENGQLRETIELMMKEMKKLHICADNTVDPRLAEGPLNFAVRFWERYKPRDTAVVVSEHVGEIKKPIPGQDGLPVSASTPAAEIISARFNERSEQVKQHVAAQFNERSGQLKVQVAAQLNGRSEQLKGQVEERSQKAIEQGKVALENSKQFWGNFRTGTLGPLWQQAQHLVNKRRENGQSTQSDSAAAEDGTQSPPVAEEAPAEPEPAAAKSSGSADNSGVAALDPSMLANGGAGGTDQISSTILIEVKIALEDGRVETLQVRAADRCKEVSHRFIQQHGLKNSFKEPLTRWLKKVEAEAERFPVNLEADLTDIARQAKQS